VITVEETFAADLDAAVPGMHAETRLNREGGDGRKPSREAAWHAHIGGVQKVGTGLGLQADAVVDTPS
jgi:hypothetical protein